MPFTCVVVTGTLATAAMFPQAEKQLNQPFRHMPLISSDFQQDLPWFLSYCAGYGHCFPSLHVICEYTIPVLWPSAQAKLGELSCACSRVIRLAGLEIR